MPKDFELAALVLSGVNVVVDLLVTIAIGAVHRQRRDAFTRYLYLAFGVWLVNDLVEALILLGILSDHIMFYTLSTLHSAFFLLAVAHLRRSEGGRHWGPGGLWRSDLINPITLSAAVVIVSTVSLHLLTPRSPLFAVPDLLFAMAMWVLMGWAIYRYIVPFDRAVAAVSVATFTVLFGLILSYLFMYLGALGPALYLPTKIASVVAHLLIIYIIAHVVARGLWRKLVAEQQDLSLLIQSSPTAILVVAEDGSVERVNAWGRSLLGLEEADASEAVPVIDRLLPGIDWSAERAERFASGAALSDPIVVPTDGKRRDLRVYIARLSAQTEGGRRDGRPRYVLIATDITDELERERVALEAERAKTLSVLSSGTIHHFHNKLLAIRTGLRFLQTRMAVEDAEGFRIPMLVRTTDQAFALSQQLAGSLRLARGSEFEVIDLTAALERAVEETSARRPSSCEVEVIDETERPPERPVLIRGVAGFLKMVFENLAVNAFDARRVESEGRLTIRVRADAHQAHITFEDAGTGIPEAARHQIFVPFFTTREDSGGTGFGLYWSRRLVESMGGSLNLEWTEVGEGSRFGLVLPLYAGGHDPLEGGGAATESVGADDAAL